MNIKEHIEAGHYPKDEKGRALVPTAEGRIVTILATDGCISIPIAARFPSAAAANWSPSGKYQGPEGAAFDLLPPPHRKVKVTAWALFSRPGRRGKPVFVATCETPTSNNPDEFFVELTGEYEEPWA